MNQVVNKLTNAGVDYSTVVSGVCLTDQGDFQAEIPVFTTWREMVQHCSLDFIALLVNDLELKKDLRTNLPLNIDLTEEVPGKAVIINIIARSVYKKKYEKKIKILEKLVEALPFPTITFNKHGFVSHWNSSCERLTKVSAESVISKKDIGRIFYNEDRLLIGQMLMQNFTLVDYRQFFPDPDLEILMEDGAVTIRGFMHFRRQMQGFYQVNCQKIFLDGEVIGVIQLIQDLNAMTMLQEDASKKQAALHSIVSHLPFPMIQSSSTGEVIFINRAGSEMLGHSQQEAQNASRNLFQMRPEIIEEFSDFIRNLSLADNDSYIHERQHSKILFWDNVHWEVTCLSPPGQNLELIWIVRNVSDKEKESQLNTAIAMVGTICHELSQPLTAIINSSQLLARTKAEDVERSQRHQKIISEQGDRLFDIYRKLQNITQVRMQKYLDTQILDLDESVEEMHFQKNDKKS
ncbi:histidine kinase dimerization/phospho-acceptor domain-containing protein [Desulfonatronovibrio magnus]|uniref:histidine kinase dimerization/phospho-acceptor domain-containing protein n=1 Tax=Desulfonatronovibrio magnus TaxID=698827 RepID=UPI0012FAE2A9|nr:histidine kinase dimerization/phospho-acceptor domain-containing protein [Desulfonatronovibrio magnus]